jgi:predicted RecA/RadA family phage recombinase
MAKTFIQEGRVIDYTASAAVKSGDVVVMGQLVGVALNDIAAGETGPVQIDGVWELPKVSASVINQGESVNWDDSASEFDANSATPAAGDLTGGCVAVADAGNGATTVWVKLNVGPNTVH